MTSLIASSIVPAVLACCACYVLFRKAWLKRLQALERDLQAFSNAMCQMADIQMKSYQKLSGDLSQIEERILDLAIPSEGANLPMERRRRVVALASKGSSVEEVAKRANVSRGEAELIMSLQKIKGAASALPPKANGETKPYAQS